MHNFLLWEWISSPNPFCFAWENDIPVIPILLTITKHLTLTDSNSYPCPILFLVTKFYSNLCEGWGGNRYGRNLILACCKGQAKHNMLLQSWYFFPERKTKSPIEAIVGYIHYVTSQ